MLIQLPSDPLEAIVDIILFVAAVLLLFLFNYLSVRILESREYAEKKLLMEFITALLGVAAFILIAMLWSSVASFVTIVPWVTNNYLTLLGPILAFLIYIALVHWLVSVDWKTSVYIALLALLFLLLFLTLVPLSGNYLDFGAIA